jgi:hypothetical protein
MLYITVNNNDKNLHKGLYKDNSGELNEKVIIKKWEKESRDKTKSLLSLRCFSFFFTLYNACILLYTLQHNTTKFVTVQPVKHQDTQKRNEYEIKRLILDVISCLCAFMAE